MYKSNISSSGTMRSGGAFKFIKFVTPQYESATKDQVKTLLTDGTNPAPCAGVAFVENTIGMIFLIIL